MATKRVVLVTGAAGNVGKEVVKTFVQQGDLLAISVHQEHQISSLQKELDLPKEKVFFFGGNLSDEKTTQQFIKEVYRHFGRIDVVIHTIGGFRSSAFLETSLEEWNSLFQLNATSAFLLARSVLPIMIKQKQGRLLFIGSKAALLGPKYMSAYAASKSALLRLVESLASEFFEQGIRVNAVLPGMIDTPQNRAAMPDATFQVSSQSVAHVLSFLASEAAVNISGALLPVG